MKIKQFPETGKHLIRYTGDTMEFQVQLTGRIVPGKAFLCTNLGNAALRRAEIIECCHKPQHLVTLESKEILPLSDEVKAWMKI